MYKSLVILFLALFAAEIYTISKRSYYDDRFHDYGIYTITNRAFAGVLTFNGTDEPYSLPILTDFDKNVVNPGQRWRLTSQSIGYPALSDTNNNIFYNSYIFLANKMSGATAFGGPSTPWNSAFDIRPMLDERFVLEYWDDFNSLRWIVSWGFGDNKMWYFQDAGDGFTLVRNKQNDVCLKSQGILNPIVAEVCNGKPEQQWKFKNLSGD